MRKILRHTTLFTAVIAMGFLGACSSDDENGDGNGNGNGNGTTSIADVAGDDENFSILVDALTRTNLLEAVADANASLTVFAPTNDAFSDLLTDLGLADLDALEDAIGTEGLANVLLYHVLGTKVMAADVTTGYVNSLGTNSNDHNLSMYINAAGGGVLINGSASVTEADIEADNGVIHVINSVIMPQPLLGLVAPNSQFSNLVTAVGVADNNPGDILSDESSYKTLFAPTNDGFNTLLTDLNFSDLNDAVATIGTNGLFLVLAYHLVDADVRAADVQAGDVTTMANQDFTVSINSGGEVVLTDFENRDAIVTTTDITGTNGTIHIINNVIVPDLN
ncbi:MAG: fasciclin domain-containing protein [Cryomorphaceae bacterium]|nr:fasciclin domain-containing protein [Cryomorphaceae bacterium]